MKICGSERLKNFIATCSDAKVAIQSLYCELENLNWNSPAEIKLRYPAAYIGDDGCVVFRVGNGRYCVFIRINYPVGIVFICFVGTYGEYMQTFVERK